VVVIVRTRLFGTKLSSPDLNNFPLLLEIATGITNNDAPHNSARHPEAERNPVGAFIAG
jgi:hypothetical protein